jgi:cysteine synthase
MVIRQTDRIPNRQAGKNEAQAPHMIHSSWTAVGNTPLMKLSSLSLRTGNLILGKAEWMNPGGSIKDRAAKGIIAAAEKSGALKPGGTIVEGTAGNTGIGLAVLGRERGYKIAVAMPATQAREKFEFLEALGVQIFKTPVVPFTDERHFFHTAGRLAEEHGWFWANQFENEANADIHQTTTGPEIWEQAEGKVDVLIAAAGTGGTLAGVSEYLRSKNPALKVVLADCDGSGLYNYVKQGAFVGTGTSITEGIGIMRLTKNFSRCKIDDAVQINDQQMLDMLLHLAEHDGMLLGTSAALNAYAAYDYSKNHPNQDLRIVTFLCDHGSRYASKVLNPIYLAERGLVRQALQ